MKSLIMLSEKEITAKKLTVTTDLLRVDNRNEGICFNSQQKMGEWVHTLFAPLAMQALQVETVDIIHGDEGGYESLRWQIFSKAGLPLHYQSWAQLYEGEGYLDILTQVLVDAFKDSIVLAFEASPSMLEVFNQNKIPYIDCSIHPIRFLPDYFLGLRTNVVEWRERLAKIPIPTSTIQDFARMSAGRSKLVVPPSLIEGIQPESALFFGQMDVDASLIYQGCMADDNCVMEALMELSTVYRKVYYKRHPHNRHFKRLEKKIKKIKGCEMLEINAYDALSLPHFEMIATLSSGTAFEARYFGKMTRCFLREQSWFDLDMEEQHLVYHGIYEAYFSQQFWDYLLGENPAPFTPILPDPFQGGLKFNLNKKWGR